MVSTSAIDNQITRFGNSVTLSVTTLSTSSEYGDDYYSTSDSTITVVHNDIVGDEEFNKEGIFVPGDKVFFAKSTEENLEVGNNILYNSSTFKIKDVVNHNIQDKNFVKEVRCSKID